MFYFDISMNFLFFIDVTVNFMHSYYTQDFVLIDDRKVRLIVNLD